RDTGVPVLNIDLIYGIDGQTGASWRTSLDAALQWRPEELYLYPLYVRPLTGLGRIGTSAADAESVWDEQRLGLYRAGRDHLLGNGYEQVSMRMFRRADAPQTAGPDDYACQTDGMIGLGCGARSYTSRLHYSFDYAVEMREVRAIIDGYTTAEDFSHAEVGRFTDGDEARRRHLLQSVLQAEGLRLSEYRERFATSPDEDFREELALFEERGWLDPDAPAAGLLRLSPEGLAHSDALGPDLFSPPVRAAMASYELK
ncbi:coproporphyrinogen III oxidase family protein, partial [Streptomyces laculatispora]|nr:coproporphyrinogen III oxidase family protein [Streptomyces laculatispora]